MATEISVDPNAFVMAVGHSGSVTGKGFPFFFVFVFGSDPVMFCGCNNLG